MNRFAATLRRVPAELFTLLALTWTVAQAYAFYWYVQVPRKAYPSLRIDASEELPLLVHVSSSMAALSVLTAVIAFGLLRLRHLSRVGAGLPLGLGLAALLVPALAGQNDLLMRYRWPLLGFVVVACAAFGILLVRFIDLRPEDSPRWLARPRVRRITLRAAAGFGFALWWAASEPLRLYPALLLFLFSLSVLLVAASFEARVFVFPLPKEDKVAVGLSGAALVLCFSWGVWIDDAESFARVRYVFSRRCIGADALVRLNESMRTEWLKTSAAFLPRVGARGRIKAWATPPGVPATRPHIVLFVIDALRWDQAFGVGVTSAAPNLRRLSAAGRSYERAYSPSSGTAQSMVSCLSGLPPGVLARLEVIPATLPSALVELGYRTATAWDLETLRIDGNFPILQARGIAALGFQSRHEPPGKSVAERDLAQVDLALERLAQADVPRLEYLHLMRTHGPFPGPTGEDDYRAAIAEADAHLGHFVAGLKQRGLDDETLLFVFGDHGEALGEHGQTGHNQTVYVEETHVPLVIVGPKVAVSVEAEPVSLMEIPWLALDVLGVSWNHGARGGRDAPHGSEGVVLVEYKMLDQVTQRGLRSRERMFYQHHLEGRSELYDLTVDEGERHPVEDAEEVRRWLDLESRVAVWEASLVEQLEALPRAR
jgi:hypothetical protein